jgi:predicted nucleotidyltransferase component of viral defense system
MIKHKEISEKATEWKVPPDTVDKDFVLGHFLNSFYSFEDNRNLFVFKGGTCLRKCYFPDYRFSQDLDFTLLDAKYKVTVRFLKRIIDECTMYSGILFGDVVNKMKKVHDNKLQVDEFVIPFWGANHPKKNRPELNNDNLPKIELDFSYHEDIKTPI